MANGKTGKSEGPWGGLSIGFRTALVGIFIGFGKLGLKGGILLKLLFMFWRGNVWLTGKSGKLGGINNGKGDGPKGLS